jgi:hypothetical protein
MHYSVIPVDQSLNAKSLNAMTRTSETKPSTTPKNSQSTFRSKTREKSGKTPEMPPVTLIRMEQLAPIGAIIVNSDGKHEDHRAVSCIFNAFPISLYRYTA